MNKEKERRKNSFTLIEVIVSLFLITIIISFLFGFFSKITKLEKNIDEIKTKVLEKNHAYLRLNHVFSQAINVMEEPFSTEYDNGSNLCLNFCFDNGIDPEKAFSSKQKAKLFVDREKNLHLEIRPIDKKSDLKRDEILLKNVKSMKFRFLDLKNELLKGYVDNGHPISQKIFWYNFWPRKVNSLPSIIYLEINNNLKFAFFLPSRNVKI